jgi:glycosyltransferase involved in cell wall biosynthesis
MKSVSVIINVFNEVDTIESEIREIISVIIEKIPGSELIVAEDGSTDSTHEIVAHLSKELNFVHSTSEYRKGYATAFRDAVELAQCPLIFFSDTGGKNNFLDFWALYNEKDSFDLIIGLRMNRSDQIYRQLLTWSYNKLLRIYFGIKIKDADSGFRLYNSSFLKEIAYQPWINKALISSEIALRLVSMGGKIYEVPIEYKQRNGQSRGLPLRKIPSVILNVIGNSPKLKRELKKLKKTDKSLL